MGWWTQSKGGESFAEGSTLLWGDRAADAFDVAIAEVIGIFMEEQGRRPSKAEVRAGIEFSLGIYDGRFVGEEEVAT